MLRVLKMFVRAFLLPSSSLLPPILAYTVLMGLLAISTTSMMCGTRTLPIFAKVVIWVTILMIIFGIAARIVIALLVSLGWISRDHE